MRVNPNFCLYRHALINGKNIYQRNDIIEKILTKNKMKLIKNRLVFDADRIFKIGNMIQIDKFLGYLPK